MNGIFTHRKAASWVFCRYLFLLLQWFLWMDLAVANDDRRKWSLANGDTLDGEIKRIDEENQTVMLRLQDGSERRLNIDDLAMLDRAWLLEWIEMEEELEQKISELGGRMEYFQAEGEETGVTDCYVYHPSGNPPDGKLRPLMQLFSPSGKGRRYLLKHMEAAEAAQMTIVACDQFRNGPSQIKRFNEAFPIITAKISHDPERVFMGGTSGGAVTAFLFSAYVTDRKWAGIYSNGGWLGGRKNHDLPYPGNMRVVMVNGDNDRGANAYLESASRALVEKGITVSVMSFEGGHQTPPPSVATKAFLWLLEDLE